MLLRQQHDVTTCYLPVFVKNIYVVVTSKPGLLSFLRACSSAMTAEFTPSRYLAAVPLHVSLIPAELFSQ